MEKIKKSTIINNSHADIKIMPIPKWNKKVIENIMHQNESILIINEQILRSMNMVQIVNVEDREKDK